MKYNSMITLTLFALIISSFILTELIRRYSLKKKILDEPNERSSHSVPVPRGGGLSTVICFLVVVGFSDGIPDNITFALIGSGIFIAVIGFWDDQGHIAAKWRLLSHFIAAFWVLFWLGDIPEFQFSGFSIDAGWIGMVVVAFLLVWMLNLFNFMDGIDGIAASEVIFVSSAGAYFSYLNGADHLSFISLVLAVSTMGFLVLNWPPAKIFMGDVGSGFLGMMIGVIAYANILEGGSIWIWLILLGIFIVDSGVTLFRRILNGDKGYEAHCSHAYQHASRKWGHKRVTIVTVIINLAWLFPIAYLEYLYQNIGVLLALIAYTPLVIIALKFNAGMADK